MKKDIHPAYFPKAKAVCACGSVYEVGSTKEKIDVEICSHCHPFYTGKENILDTAGRVDRFKKRTVASAAKKASIKKAKA
jgi:large subunit ribosomal protein L31